GADANANAAFDFEGDQRFANRRPRDFQLFGKIAFGGKPAADDIFAAVDQGAELIGNLTIKASCFHGFERHARLSLTIPCENRIFLALIAPTPINWLIGLTN